MTPTFCKATTAAAKKTPEGRAWLRSLWLWNWAFMHDYNRATVRVITAIAIPLIVAIAAPAAAQEPTPLKLPVDARPVAARLADVAMIGVTGVRAYQAWRAYDRTHAFLEMGCEAAVTLVSIEVIKRAVHRRRPDGSDNLSFPSGHTGYAEAMGGWKVAVPVAGLRQMAWKHYFTDTLGGFLTGFVATKVCR